MNIKAKLKAHWDKNKIHYYIAGSTAVTCMVYFNKSDRTKREKEMVKLLKLISEDTGRTAAEATNIVDYIEFAEKRRTDMKAGLLQLKEEGVEFTYYPGLGVLKKLPSAPAS